MQVPIIFGNLHLSPPLPDLFRHLLVKKHSEIKL